VGQAPSREAHRRRRVHVRVTPLKRLLALSGVFNASGLQSSDRIPLVPRSGKGQASQESDHRNYLWRNLMKAVVIGESSGANRDAIMAVYPRHKVLVDKFVARGVFVGIGPFADGGNMAIFKTRAEAEAFAREDPFILKGLVKSFVIKDWRDSLLPE
jgi:uncharacterized protein